MLKLANVEGLVAFAVLLVQLSIKKLPNSLPKSLSVMEAVLQDDSSAFTANALESAFEIVDGLSGNARKICSRVIAVTEHVCPKGLNCCPKNDEFFPANFSHANALSVGVVAVPTVADAGGVASLSGESPALCTTCDTRLTDTAIRACSVRDCPHAQQEAA